MNGGQIQMKFLETRNGLIEQINKIKMADFEISEAKKIKNDELILKQRLCSFLHFLA